MFCANIDELKEAMEGDEVFFSSNAMKPVYYFNWFLMIFELFFILMPFVSIPLVRSCVFLSCRRKQDKSEISAQRADMERLKNQLKSEIETE